MAEKKEKRYVSDNAQLMAEWNWKKNDELGVDPQKLTCGSDKKVWWICNQCKNPWMDTVSHRSEGRRCPVCNKKSFASKYRMTKLSKTGSLAEKHPDIAAQWHPTKNGLKTPNSFSLASGAKVWWMCSKGHEWQATIDSRCRGRGCPFCSGYYPIKGENDLQTINPTLAKEWNWKKNNGLTPLDVLPNSNKKVWWMCDKGHEWQAVIASRSDGRRCPVCAGKKVLSGFNDLATVRPEIVVEWHPIKNGELSPTNVTVGSGKKVSVFALPLICCQIKWRNLI